MRFCFNSVVHKMNEIVNKFLLAGDESMPAMHLKQPGFNYSACGPFTINKERIEKFRQTGNTGYIYKNGLDKAWFQHDMTYDKYKDLTKRTQPDKVLRDKAFEIASNPKYNGYQRGLASMVFKIFDKKSKGNGVNFSNQQFKDNIWDVDLADMQLISKWNKRIRYLLCVVDLFSIYAWAVPLKDEKGIIIVNAFQNILEN